MDNLYLETCRDHNATSYSTETQGTIFVAHENIGRDHNATSYSTETDRRARTKHYVYAEIITLRAIALLRRTEAKRKAQRS